MLNPVIKKESVKKCVFMGTIIFAAIKLFDMLKSKLFARSKKDIQEPKLQGCVHKYNPETGKLAETIVYWQNGAISSLIKYNPETEVMLEHIRYRDSDGTLICKEEFSPEPQNPVKVAEYRWDGTIKYIK